jgi:hypothetical protein
MFVEFDSPSGASGHSDVTDPLERAEKLQHLGGWMGGCVCTVLWRGVLWCSWLCGVVAVLASLLAGLLLRSSAPEAAQCTHLPTQPLP